MDTSDNVIEIPDTSNLIFLSNFWLCFFLLTTNNN